MPAAKLPVPGNRPRIGLLFDGITELHSGPAWLGAVEAARDADADLVCFVGRTLPPHLAESCEEPHVLKLPSLQNVDALVYDPRMLVDRPERLGEIMGAAELPTVLFGTPLDSTPVVTTEVVSCLRNAIDHLLQVHGRRRVALLLEHPSWPQAEERERVYREAHEAHGVAVDPVLLVHNAALRVRAAEAVQTLVRLPQPPDAVVAASDPVADQVIRELLEHNLRVPEDVSVIGGEDLDASRFLDPTLTTIQIPWQRMARAAVERAATWVRTGEAPSRAELLCALQVRASCGCAMSDSELMNLTISIGGGNVAESFRRDRDSLVASLQRLSLRLGASLKSRGEALIGDLVNGFVQALEHRNPMPFQAQVTRLLRVASGPDAGPWHLQKLLLVLCEQVQAFRRDVAGRELAQTFLLNAMDLVHDSAWRWQRLSRVASFHTRERRAGISRELLRALDLRRMNVTASRLAAEIGINRFCACVYTGSRWPSAVARVYLAGRGGKPVEFVPGGMVLRSYEMPPRFLFPRDARQSVLVAPIQHQELGGYVVMEQSARDWTVYTEFARNLAVALRETLLIQNMREQSGRMATLNEQLNREVAQRKRTQEKLAHMALHDPLTGLPNRSLMLDRLEHALRRNRRATHPSFAVLFLDLDGFKQINDHFGHRAGDAVLQEVSRRLQHILRPGDTVARMGGDEFVILVENLRLVQEARQVAARAHQALRKPIPFEKQSLGVGTSIGIALSAQRYQRPEEILRDADQAMYRAKSSGDEGTFTVGLA